MGGDITYIRTWEGFVYLATVLDCHTKKTIGYAVADHMRTSLGYRTPNEVEDKHHRTRQAARNQILTPHITPNRPKDRFLRKYQYTRHSRGIGPFEGVGRRCGRTQSPSWWATWNADVAGAGSHSTEADEIDILE